MIIFRIVTLMFIVCVIAFVITQIFVPALQGRALFPWFRTQRKLETELADLKQKEAEDKVKDVIDNMKKEKDSGSNT